nr:DNA polymerase III subunit gamma and tau [Acidipropionibacterium jensenii]
MLTGPETPQEPDGLESDEVADDPESPADESDEASEHLEAVRQLAAAEELVIDEPPVDVEPDLPDSDDAGQHDPDSASTRGHIEAIPATQQDDGEPPLALYRRYRPDTFDEVIGQDHVVEPLKRAIINNRVNHAYLFSGPRGCGKTTSARILARALNCEKGPTPNPCGVCQSCRDLARGGAGSIDVIEIDAASHGGVEDARDLRERAFFAPVSSRYKIYIIDEAHMVTTQGFNALLKLVEEPPPHVKFIFATTEPEKVIGTIRSRTHHYPFRLVPPKILISYLEKICSQEGIRVERSVLPLVVRAGGGSVRDSLSVLDQLLGGAEADGVSYSRAAALLGYTPDALLDQIVDAFAAGDAHEVFATIDKVIEIGQDPRRFTEDLLRRVRDLVILSAVPDACSTGLIDASPEQATRLSHQAAGMGSGELTRAAEVLATGLTQMRGTTAPRLHLELMCSRVLLPSSDSGERGYNARLERLERRVGMAGAAVETGETPSGADSPGQPTQSPGSQQAAGQSGPRQGRRPPSQQSGGPSAPQQGIPQQGSPQTGPQQGNAHSGPQEGSPQAGSPQGNVSQGNAPQGNAQAGPQRPAQQPSSQRRPASPGPRRRPRPSERNYRSGSTQSAEPPVEGSRPPASPPSPAPDSQPPAPQQTSGNSGQSGEQRPADQPGPQSPAPQASAPQGAGPGQVDISMLRREWPRVLDVVKDHGRVIWMVLTQYAQILEVHGRRATIGFANPGALDMFASGPHSKVLHDAVVEVLGVDLDFDPILDGPGGGPSGGPQGGPGGPGDQGGQGGSGGRGGSAPHNPGQSRNDYQAPGSSWPGPSGEAPPDPSEPGRDEALRPGADEPDGSDSGAPGVADGSDRSGAGSARPASNGADRAPAGSGPVSRPADAAPAGHRWSQRAKEGIREMSHHVEQEPPEDEDLPASEWDSEAVETPQYSAAELIRTELGGVVIDIPVVE